MGSGVGVGVNVGAGVAVGLGVAVGGGVTVGRGVGVAVGLGMAVGVAARTGLAGGLGVEVALVIGGVAVGPMTGALVAAGADVAVGSPHPPPHADSRTPIASKSRKPACRIHFVCIQGSNIIPNHACRYQILMDYNIYIECET